MNELQPMVEDHKGVSWVLSLDEWLFVKFIIYVQMRLDDDDDLTMIDG